MVIPSSNKKDSKVDTKRAGKQYQLSDAAAIG